MRETLIHLAFAFDTIVFSFFAIKLEKAKRKKDLYDEIHCGIWMIIFCIAIFFIV